MGMYFFHISGILQKNKSAGDLSSPKLKSLFKQFVQTWNKRKLPPVSRIEARNLLEIHRVVGSLFFCPNNKGTDQP